MSENYTIPMFGPSATRSYYNACVGNNGLAEDEEYCIGYITSSIMSIERTIQIIEHKENNPDYLPNYFPDYLIDTIVYPICFSMRHAIEILLKIISKTVLKIAKNRSRPEDNDPCKNLSKNLKTHKIEVIWEIMKKLATSHDERYEPLINRIEPIILEISKIDETGETFRYAFDRTEEHKHLTSVQTIPLIVLLKNAKLLKNDIEKLIEKNHEIDNEYSHNLYTKRLSYYQLEELAKELPQKEKWGTTEFKKIKKHIIEKYNLKSAREFDRAVNIIKNNHELGHFIGIFHNLFDVDLKVFEIDNENPSVTKDDILFFYELYTDQKTIIDCYNIKKIPLTEEEIIEKIKNITTKKLEKISAAINALYYLNAYDTPYSKCYYVSYFKCLNEFRSAESSDNPEGVIQHLLRKGVALHRIYKSLDHLKQRDIGEAILKKYPFVSEQPLSLTKSNEDNLKHFRATDILQVGDH